jgi:hypothetical protein
MYDSSDVIELKRGEKMYLVRSRHERPLGLHLSLTPFLPPARPEANRPKFPSNFPASGSAPWRIKIDLFARVEIFAHV